LQQNSCICEFRYNTINPLAQDQLKCLTKCLPQSAQRNERSNGHWKLHNRCSKIDFVPKYTISDAKERKQQTNIQHLIMNFNLGHKGWKKKHFHLTQVCILPFFNIERGNGGVETYPVDIMIMIACLWHFPTQFVHGCRFDTAHKRDHLYIK